MFSASKAVGCERRVNGRVSDILNPPEPLLGIPNSAVRMSENNVKCWQMDTKKKN